MDLISKLPIFQKLTLLKRKDFPGIYIILNTVNNKYYLGSSKKISYRWQQHRSLLKHNKHNNSYLQNAWNKYGSNSFTFLIIEKTYAVKEREDYYLSTYKSYNEKIGYNIKRTTKEIYNKVKVSAGHNSQKKKICKPEEIERLRAMSKLAANSNKIGEQRHGSILNNLQVTQIREMVELGFCNEIVAKLFKVSDGLISTIKSGRRWKHLPYKSPFLNLKKGKELIQGVKSFDEIYNLFFGEKQINHKAKLSATQILNIKNMYLLGFDASSITKTLKLTHAQTRSVLRFNANVEIKPDLNELSKQQ